MTTLNLADEFRGVAKKDGLGEENLYMPVYKTGIDAIDYHNGRVEGEENEKIVVGVEGGKILTVIGPSGSGKSTAAIQIGTHIADQFEHATVTHFDFERATNIARIKGLTGWSDEKIKNKYHLMNRKIYSESVYKMCKSIANIKNKKENFDLLKYDTGIIDYNGDKVYGIPPSIVIVDSWAVMVPQNIAEEEKLSGSMSASAIAKENNSIIKRLAGPLEEGNIILIIVNHITEKIEIGPVKTKAKLNYLKQNESIPGGSSCIYMASSLLRLEPGKKLEEDETLGVKGFMSVGEFLKSRSNESGKKFDMVFSQRNGLDNLMTNFNILKDNGYLKGSPRAYYFEDCPDVKFTQKKFREKYNESVELQETVARLVDEVMVQFVPLPEKMGSEGELELVECVDEENDVWLGSDGNYYTGEGEEVEYEG